MADVSLWGVGAALAAPLVMTIGFLVWDDHWKGSAFSLNLFKCCLASIGFVILSCTVPFQRDDTVVREDGIIFPPDIFTQQAVGFLFLSSTIGIIIGDWTWLQALKLLGAKRVILMDSLKPFLASGFGWLVLDEQLAPLGFLGIFLTMAGILLVSLDQSKDDPNKEGRLKTQEQLDQPAGEVHFSNNSDPEMVSKQPPNAVMQAVTDDKTIGTTNKEEASSNPRRWEVIMGFFMSSLNVVLDTYGSVLTKQHGKYMTVWEVNLCRFGFASVVLLVISLVLSLFREMSFLLWKSDRPAATCNQDDASIRSTVWYQLPVAEMERKDWILVSGGVVFVTFLTPVLSNYALFEIALALALTLGSIAPLYELPLSYFLRKQQPTWKSCLGAALSVSGVVVLVLSKAGKISR